MVLEPRLKAPLFVLVWVTFETHNWGQIISLSSHKAISSSPSLLWHNAQFVNKKNPQLRTMRQKCYFFHLILFCAQCTRVNAWRKTYLPSHVSAQNYVYYDRFCYLLTLLPRTQGCISFNFEITTNGKAKTLKILDSPQKMVQNWELGPLPKDCVKWGP